MELNQGVVHLQQLNFRFLTTTKTLKKLNVDIFRGVSQKQRQLTDYVNLIKLKLDYIKLN